MNLLAPETIEISQLPSLPFAARRELPNCAAVYFVLDESSKVLYIGRSKSLCFRWQQHHRLKQFSQLPLIYIAWLIVEDEQLLSKIEQTFIEFFNPYLNKQSVPYQKHVSITFRIPPELLTEIEALAKDSGNSFNAELIHLVELGVEAKEQERQSREASRTPVGA